MQQEEKRKEMLILFRYLETHNWCEEDCDWSDFIHENRDDYMEYREWYLCCVA